jgi:hypothetical protein
MARVQDVPKHHAPSAQAKGEGVLKELASALAKAQAMMKPALKDSTNPHFKSKYADLTSIWEACRDALTKNGLSVAQVTEFDGELCFIRTILLLVSSSTPPYQALVPCI